MYIPLTFITRKKEAVDTESFIFEKPQGFTYQAGQFGVFTLPSHLIADTRNASHSFSFASAPFEEHLMITMRLRPSIFKNGLQKLKPGDSIELDAPYGLFTLEKETPPAVFIAGGVGITLVRSILLQAIHDGASQEITVFYANRRLDDAAFFQEIQQHTKDHHNITFIPILSKPHASWSGEQGHIDKKMIDKYIEDYTQSIFYLSGILEMVHDIGELLSQAGVSESNIIREEFSGYSYK